MTLTPEQVQLVKSTFEMIAPRAADVAALFYGRLFEIAPQFRPMFKHSMEDQGKKLMDILTIAVRNLDNLGSIIPAVNALGARHVDYGVQPEDYDIVGTALLWTLQAGLGDAFTDDVHNAWAVAYTVLAETAIGNHYPVMA